nr:DNA recombination/repair protein RecA [Lactococcus lactis]
MKLCINGISNIDVYRTLLIALQAVAETQKNNGYVAYIDTENSLDIEYAENLGVKAESLIFAHPDTDEEAFYMINELSKQGF